MNLHDLTGEHSLVVVLVGWIILMAITLAKEGAKFIYMLLERRNENIDEKHQTMGKKIEEIIEAVRGLTSEIKDFKLQFGAFNQRMIDLDKETLLLKDENKLLFFCLKDMLGDRYLELMKRAVQEKDFL